MKWRQSSTQNAIFFENDIHLGEIELLYRQFSLIFPPFFNFRRTLMQIVKMLQSLNNTEMYARV